MKLYYFSHSRTALKYGLISLGLKPGEQILIPDFICDVVLHPLKQLGLKHQFFPIHDDLTPNWSELEKQITPESKAIFMVHYFGQPQFIRDFQDFCDKHQLFLIEDNAQGFCGLYEGEHLGTFGDIGFSSPRKTLDLPSGGILYIKQFRNKLVKNTIENLQSFQIKYWNETIKRKAKQNVFLKNFTRKHIKPRPVYWDPRAFNEKEIQDFKIDSFSKNIISQVDDKKIRSKRMETYFHWNDFTAKNGLTSVFSNLGKETSPLVFPAYTSGPKENRIWFNWGWENGYNISSWPSLPDEIIKKDGDALNRWNKLICFPIE